MQDRLTRAGFKNQDYQDATSQPHGYLMLDLKPTTDDRQRFKTNVLPGEVQQGDTDVMTKFVQKQSYLQPPALNAMYNAEKRMCDILETPQLTADQKSKLYSNHLIVS